MMAARKEECFYSKCSVFYKCILHSAVRNYLSCMDSFHRKVCCLYLTENQQKWKLNIYFDMFIPLSRFYSFEMSGVCKILKKFENLQHCFDL